MKTKLIKKINKQGLWKSYHYINSPQHYRSHKVLEQTIRKYINTIITQ
jgi:hypothetical protein